MMDRIVWTLIDKTSGLPVPNKTTVVARPVQNTTSAGDIPMPEVGTGTAIYATTNEVPHGIYRIRVDSTDTDDEVEVEAGRVKWTKASGELSYPVMDRVVDAKCVLSGVLDDTVETAGSADLVLAIAAATGAKPRELVLDQDVTLSTSVTDLAQPLTVDLNGRTLTLNGNIYSQKKIIIRNGVIVWGSGRTITSLDSVTFIGVRFSGTTATMGSANTSYIGCYGLTVNTNAGANGDAATVVGGQHSFGHIGQINLTDLGSNTGSTRATWLQALIDTWYSWLVLWKSAVEWLTSSRRSILDEWVNYPQIIRNSVGGMNTEKVITIADVSISGDSWVGGGIMAAMINFWQHGIRPCVQEVYHSASGFSILRGCVTATGTSVSGSNISFVFYTCNSITDYWIDSIIPRSERFRQKIKLYRKLNLDVNAPLEQIPLNIGGTSDTVSLVVDAIDPRKFTLTVLMDIRTSMLPYPSGKTAADYNYVISFELCPEGSAGYVSVIGD